MVLMSAGQVIRIVTRVNLRDQLLQHLLGCELSVDLDEAVLDEPLVKVRIGPGRIGCAQREGEKDNEQACARASREATTRYTDDGNPCDMHVMPTWSRNSLGWAR